ncbi:unnamed protein product, partial [Rotaria magnacalcarata]
KKTHTTSNPSNNKSEVENVFDLVAKLYHLQQVEELKEKQSTMNENREHVVNIPSHTNSSTTMQQQRKIINQR